MEDIDHYNIPVYNFPYDIEEDDEETIADNSELRVGSMAFARLRMNLMRVLLFRLFCRLPLSGQRRKSKSPGNLCELVVTLGESSKSTIHSTRISGDSDRRCSTRISPISRRSRTTSCTRTIERRSCRERSTAGTNTTRIAVSFPRIWRLRAFDSRRSN